MPATVLAERVGWEGSIRWFRDNVKRLRPEHRPVDPADRRVSDAAFHNDKLEPGGDALSRWGSSMKHHHYRVPGVLF
jgi:hypothetical protein